MQPSNTSKIIKDLRKYGTVRGKFSRGPGFIIFITNHKNLAEVFDYITNIM